MTTPLLSGAPVGAGEVAAALPYPGEDPAALTAVAERIGDARTHLARINDAVFDARTGLMASWTGGTAAIGTAEVDRLRTATELGAYRLDRARSAILDCSAELSDVRTAVDELRPRWRKAEQQTRDLDVTIRLNTDPTQLPVLTAQLTTSGSHRTAVTEDWQLQLDRADAATDRCRRRLDLSLQGEVYAAGAGVAAAGLGAALGTDGLVADDAYRAAAGSPSELWNLASASMQAFALAGAGAFPPPGAVTPQQVASAWNTRSALEQQALIHRYPQLVGGTDGVPALARDQANRLHLARLATDLTAELASIRSPSTAAEPGGAGTMWAASVPYQGTSWETNDPVQLRLESELANLQLLQSQLSSGVLLLGFTLAGAGRAIVSHGNPDTATHVGTFVPGTNSDIGSLSTDSNWSRAFRDAAVAEGAAGTAVVTWIGYDSPQYIELAAYDRFADAGAPQLVAFQEGLRATHAGPAADYTVIGFSYGGLLVGGAASTGAGLPADRVVLLASAGLELSSAADLRLQGVPAGETPGRVYAGSHPKDIINITGFAHPGLPTVQEFGANPLPVGSFPNGGWAAAAFTVTSRSAAWASPPLSVDAHLDYGRPGSVAAGSVGKVIAGRTP